MTVVFRVQDKTGRGPWRPGFSHKWVEPRNDHKHLLPYYVEFNQTLPRYIQPHAGCGCSSIDQLKRWFTKSEYDALKRLGYSAVKIKADEILARSETQVVFRRNKPLSKAAVRFDLYG
jgi:hypothetical protein